MLENNIAIYKELVSYFVNGEKCQTVSSFLFNSKLPFGQFCVKIFVVKLLLEKLLRAKLLKIWGFILESHLLQFLPYFSF